AALEARATTAPWSTKIVRSATASCSAVQDLAQELLRALVLRRVEEPLRDVLLDDFAAVHEDHAVRDRLGKAHLVRDAQHAHALAGEHDHRVEHLLDHL